MSHIEVVREDILRTNEIIKVKLVLTKRSFTTAGSGFVAAQWSGVLSAE